MLYSAPLLKTYVQNASLVFFVAVVASTVLPTALLFSLDETENKEEIIEEMIAFTDFCLMRAIS